MREVNREARPKINSSGRAAQETGEPPCVENQRLAFLHIELVSPCKLSRNMKERTGRKTAHSCCKLSMRSPVIEAAAPGRAQKAPETCQQRE